MPTTLTTARLRLSPFTEQDQADLFAYASDPRVAATVTWDAHATPAASLEFIRFVGEKTNETPGKYFLPLAVRERDT